MRTGGYFNGHIEGRGAGLGNYQKKFCTRKSAKKISCKASHAKETWNKLKKETLHDLTLKNKISCSEKLSFAFVVTLKLSALPL